MKSVFFVRHAKSSWENFNIPDHDRPLNKRGKKDALFMGHKMALLGWKPEIIISSTAKRAVKTTKKINKSLKINNINFTKDLYLASPSKIIFILNSLKDEYQSAMIVAHNPAMTEIINYFSDEYIYNVPTCGIFKVDFDIDKWEELSTYNGKLIKFIYPKMFTDEK